MASEIGKLRTTAAMVPHPRLRSVETLPNILFDKAASLKLDNSRQPLDGGGRHGPKWVFGTQFSLRLNILPRHYTPTGQRLELTGWPMEGVGGTSHALGGK